MSDGVRKWEKGDKAASSGVAPNGHTMNCHGEGPASGNGIVITMLKRWTLGFGGYKKGNDITEAPGHKEHC